MPPLTDSGLEASIDKLEVLNAADKERVAKETALNELQSFVFDLNDKLYQVGKGLVYCGGRKTLKPSIFWPQIVC